MEFTFKEIIRIKRKMRYFKKMGYKCVTAEKTTIAYSNTIYMFSLSKGRYDESPDITIRYLGDRAIFKLTQIMTVENNMEPIENVDLFGLIDYLIENYDNITSLHYCKDLMAKYEAHFAPKWEAASRAFKEELKQEAINVLSAAPGEVDEATKTFNFQNLGNLAVMLNDPSALEFMLSYFADNAKELDSISVLLRAEKLYDTAEKIGNDELIAKTSNLLLPILENELNRPIQMSEAYLNKSLWESVASEESVKKRLENLFDKLQSIS